MTKHICRTCGTQYSASVRPPETCAICEDERQYVGWAGQAWTCTEDLRREHRLRIEEDGGMLALGMSPAFAIDQRAFLLETDAGNILWESLPLVTEEAVEAIQARGGADWIIVSHPHFYSAMGDWSDALGGVPILLHGADRRWIQRPHPAIELWSGDLRRLSAEVSLVRCGGHFSGSTALHWARGPRPGGALFSGDALQVGLDRRHVSFMYSYPNLVPMRTDKVVAMRDRLVEYDFEDVFGYTWGRDIRGEGRAAVNRSFERHLEAVASGAPGRLPTSRTLRMTVLGARGRVGRRVVAEALERGHRVTAVVRDPAQLGELPEGAQAEVGDAGDVADVVRLSADADVVVSALRPLPGEDAANLATTRGMLEGIAQADTRLIVVGGAATLRVPGSDGTLLLDDPHYLPAEFRPIGVASALQHGALRDEPRVDWVYLSPPAELEPGVRTGHYRTGSDELLMDGEGRSRISMEDLAVALVDEAEHARRSRDRFTVAY